MAKSAVAARSPGSKRVLVAFGRTGEENFTKKITKSAKRQAVKQALSLKNAEKAIKVVKYDFKGQTKDAAKLLNTEKLSDKNVLMVTSEKTDLMLRSTNNLPNVKLVRATYLNVFDLLNADAILFDEAALKATTNWLKEATNE